MKPAKEADQGGSSKFTDGPTLWPGRVADLYRYREFVFPGQSVPPAPPLEYRAIAEKIADRADTICRNRLNLEGHSEVWVGILIKELTEWLAGRAGEGSNHAQLMLADSSSEAVRWFQWSLNKKHEGALSYARKNPAIPGLVSLNPEIYADSREFLKQIDQGCETGVPMALPPGKTKSKRNVYKAQHRLVAHLYEYMQMYRDGFGAKELGVPDDHPEIPDWVKKILALAPLGMSSWPQWHKEGLKIIHMATDGNPAGHPAFSHPALSPLINQLPASRQAKNPLAKELNGAWKDLAESMSSPSTT